MPGSGDNVHLFRPLLRPKNCRSKLFIIASRDAADINQTLAVVYARQHSWSSLPKQRRQGFIQGHGITWQRMLGRSTPAHTPWVLDNLAAQSLRKCLGARQVLRGVQMQSIFYRVTRSINACFQRVERSEEHTSELQSRGQ